MTKLPNSATVYILKGLLVPFSDANIKLSFKPAWFFNDLEKISNKKRQTIRNAYYKAIKKGLIELDEQNVPRLTEHGRLKVKQYKPRYLKGAQLIVMFDIPEGERWKRQHLRSLLKELSFCTIQKSVWASAYDHREYIKAEIKQFNLSSYVVVYEAKKLTV